MFMYRVLTTDCQRGQFNLMIATAANYTPNWQFYGVTSRT